MARRSTPSTKWNFSSAKILTTKIAPVCYYQEDEIFIDEIEPLLEDISINEFLELYKQHNHNHFKNNSKIVFYSDGPDASNVHLLFNDSFFDVYKEDRYYYRLNTFKDLVTYLAKDNYPNQFEYKKAVDYIEGLLGLSFLEGGVLISLKFDRMEK